MLRFLILSAVLSIPVVSTGQDVPVSPTADIDQAEIMRWGDRVVVSGEGPRAGEEVLFTQAMLPPEDDSDKWYLSVWGPSKDEKTIKMVELFERDPNLTPFTATPPTGKKAWSHFNWFKSDDPTQSFRFADFKIPLAGPFPVVTITPPRNTKFWLTVNGKKTPVCVDLIHTREVKDAKELKARIIKSVSLYCKKLQAEGGGIQVIQRQQPAVHQFSGHQQAPTQIPIGRSPDMPAAWQGIEPPPYREFNPQWPAVFPAEPVIPVALTFEQIKAIVPEAPDNFVLEHIKNKTANPEAILAAWDKVKNAPGFFSLIAGQASGIFTMFCMGAMLTLMVWNQFKSKPTARPVSDASADYTPSAPMKTKRPRPASVQ